MKKAICLIRAEPHYRREAFVNGLKRAGYSLVERGHAERPEDLLVIWNRYGSNGAMADAWEQAGGTVLVAENGYIGKDALSRQYYAVSVHGHNGSGQWPRGDGSRFAALNIELQPWQVRDGYSLICGQRGIGTRLMASPPDWHKSAASRLKKEGNPIHVRLHPGNHEPQVPLEQDLARARDCVIWSSSSGVKALVLGIPVRYDAPFWICSPAATRLDQPLLYDDAARLAAIERMAWAQWSVEELESGMPFLLLAGLARGDKQ